MKLMLLVALCALTLTTFAAGASLDLLPQAAQRETAPRQRITVASNVRLRREPQVAAEELARLGFGTIVREMAQTKTKEQVAGAEDYWYRVSTPDGREGWIFGALSMPFDAARRAGIYLKIAAPRLKVENPNFADSSDLYQFLTRVLSDPTATPAERAELELSRLLALHQTLASIPMEKLETEPLKSWVKQHEAEAVYSEPAGQWFARSELFWKLHTKYRQLPVAERIAWEAAQIPLPGECEGYVPCYLYLLSVAQGQYLKHHPRGAHAEEALKQIGEMLSGVVEDAKTRRQYTWPSNAASGRDERTQLRQSIIELRAAVARTQSPARTRLLAQLDRLVGK